MRRRGQLLKASVIIAIERSATERSVVRTQYTTTHDLLIRRRKRLDAIHRLPAQSAAEMAAAFKENKILAAFLNKALKAKKARLTEAPPAEIAEDAKSLGIFSPVDSIYNAAKSGEKENSGEL